MSEREQERAAVVAWLRACADACDSAAASFDDGHRKHIPVVMRYEARREALKHAADDIESGLHARSPANT